MPPAHPPWCLIPHPAHLHCCEDQRVLSSHGPLGLGNARLYRLHAPCQLLDRALTQQLTRAAHVQRIKHLCGGTERDAGGRGGIELAQHWLRG